MAFLEDVLVSQIRIGVSDAGPGNAVAELGLRNGPERVAVPDRVLRYCERRSQRSRHDNLRTDLEELGITEAGIQCQEFLPAVSIAKARSGKLPERVAGFDRDDRQLTRASQ